MKPAKKVRKSSPKHPVPAQLRCSFCDRDGQLIEKEGVAAICVDCLCGCVTALGNALGEALAAKEK